MSNNNASWLLEGMMKATKNLCNSAIIDHTLSMRQASLEIVFDQEVQALLDSFSACFGIRIVFYSPHGEVLKEGCSRTSDSVYCSLLQQHVFGEQRCLRLDEQMRQRAQRERRMISYRCHAGMIEVIMPIHAEGTLMGFVMIGQIRHRAGLPQEVTNHWKRLCGSRRLWAAYEELPLVDQNKIDATLHLFSALVDYIVTQKMVRLKGNLLLEQIIIYLEENIHRPIRLGEVARHIHRSPSTVSHLFRKHLGKNFKRALIEMKLEKAEEIMISHPELTISQIAGRVGYDDPFQFSTIYRRHRRRPPSEHLRRCRQQD
jgi:AraC-like DNA-binding protein